MMRDRRCWLRWVLQYDDIISWADMYDTASIEAKKMIVSALSSE